MARKQKRSATNKSKRQADYEKRRSNIQNQDQQEDNKDQPSKSKCNDVSWYASNIALLEGSSSLAWLSPVGAPWTLNTESGYLGKVLNDQYSPGICVLRTVGVPGVTGNFYSPINIAARNIYSWIRHANSGGRNYEAQDLAVYLLAMDEIYSFHAFLQRIYGVAQLYSVYNRYYPKRIIEAMGVDFEDVMNHLADFRYFINSIGTKIGSFAMPNTMSYFERHKWMYSGLYVDSTSVKAQTYFYSPFGYRVYQEPISPSGKPYLRLGSLKFHKFSTKYQRQLTVNDLMDIMKEMITPISASEDLGIISGDIIKAFGVDHLHHIGTIAENYQVLPSYDLEVLSQIQNATVFSPETLKAGSLDITTNSGQCITCSPAWNYDGDEPTQQANGYCADRLLNMYKDIVTPADTMVATRLTAIGIKDPEKKEFRLHSCGSDICCGMTLYNMETSSSLTYITVRKGYTNIDSMLKGITNLSAFDFHPMVCYGLMDDEGKAVHYSRNFQLNNTTVVGKAELVKMHETALISQFDCPQVGA